jgi:hypothetical protein
VGDERFAILDQTEFRGCAAHVEGHQIRATRSDAEGRRGQCTTGRTGFQHTDRELGGRIDRRYSPIRQQNVWLVGDAKASGPRAQIGEVSLGQPLHVDVGDRG